MKDSPKRTGKERSGGRGGGPYLQRPAEKVVKLASKNVDFLLWAGILASLLVSKKVGPKREETCYLLGRRQIFFGTMEADT